MRAAIDLRPQSRKDRSRRAVVHVPRLLSVLLLSVFLLFVAATTVVGFVFSRTLREERTVLDGRVADLLNQQTSMVRELNRLKTTERLYGEALELLRREIPALEFLSSLEASLPPGVWLTKVTFSEEKVVVGGMAYVESDVVAFGRALTEASVVRSVGLPVSSRVSVSGGNRVRFDLTCSLNGLEAVTPQEETVSEP